MISRLPLVSVLCAVLFGAFGQFAASATDGGSDTNLEIRTFKVHTRSFYAALKNVPDAQTDDVSTSAIRLKSVSSVLGVDLTAPGRTFAFKESLGLLFVKATPSELDTVERNIAPLNKDAPEVHITARVIKMSEADADAILKAGTPVDTKQNYTVEIMTDAKATPLLRTLESSGGMETLDKPDATMASLEHVQMRSDNPTVDTSPALLADDHTIFLQATVNTPEKLTAQAIVWDNQTLVLASNKSGANQTRLLVFITATVVDTAGNRVYSDDRLPFDPSKIPTQGTLVTHPAP